jgi:hypothetical protein
MPRDSIAIGIAFQLHDSAIDQSTQREHCSLCAVLRIQDERKIIAQRGKVGVVRKERWPVGPIERTERAIMAAGKIKRDLILSFHFHIIPHYACT